MAWPKPAFTRATPIVERLNEPFTVRQVAEAAQVGCAAYIVSVMVERGWVVKDRQKPNRATYYRRTDCYGINADELRQSDMENAFQRLGSAIYGWCHDRIQDAESA